MNVSEESRDGLGRGRRKLESRSIYPTRCAGALEGTRGSKARSEILNEGVYIREEEKNPLAFIRANK
jgi:hypothetical protein